MTPISNRKRGTGLVEVAISAAVFFLIVAMVCEALLAAVRAKNKSEAKIESWRHGSVATERLRRELATCVRLYAPDPLSPVQNFTPLDTAPLRFQRTTSAGPVEVSYWFDPVALTLMRQQGTDPARPVVRGVRSFRLDHATGDMLIKARLYVREVADPILAEGRALSL